jgi:hypothetical protein
MCFALYALNYLHVYFNNINLRVDLMFMVPCILVVYVQLKVQLDVLFMYSLFLSIS